MFSINYKLMRDDYHRMPNLYFICSQHSLPERSNVKMVGQLITVIAISLTAMLCHGTQREAGAWKEEQT